MEKVNLPFIAESLYEIYKQLPNDIIRDMVLINALLIINEDEYTNLYCLKQIEAMKGSPETWGREEVALD